MLPGCFVFSLAPSAKKLRRALSHILPTTSCPVLEEKVNPDTNKSDQTDHSLRTSVVLKV